MRSIKLFSVSILILVLGVQTVQAQTEVGGTSPLDVFVEVQGVCQVFTEPVIFPFYDPAAGSQGQGFIYVNCAVELPYWIALDVGQNFLGDARSMIGPSGPLAYQLFNPFDGLPWGDRGMPFSTNDWDAVAGIGFGGTEEFPVIGEIPGGQAVEPGFYSDTVNVTVWY